MNSSFGGNLHKNLKIGTLECGSPTGGNISLRTQISKSPARSTGMEILKCGLIFENALVLNIKLNNMTDLSENFLTSAMQHVILGIDGKSSILTQPSLNQNQHIRPIINDIRTNCHMQNFHKF